MRFNTCLQVDLLQFRYNYELISSRSDKPILLMVKANAYGHGMIEISKYAFYELKIQCFGVATLGEAIILRKKLSSLDVEIYVFSDLENEINFKSSLRVYNEFHLIPVIGKLEYLNALVEESLEIPLCIKLDTGMNRLGICYEDLDKVITTLEKKNLSIHHLMTHLSINSTSKKEIADTNAQLIQFKSMKEKIKKNKIQIKFLSISKSLSLLNKGLINLNNIIDESTHTRPGLSMYGPTDDSLTSQNWKGQNISSLQAGILKTCKVKKGDEFGYGMTVIPRDGILVTLGIGYGDGFSTVYKGLKLNIEEFSVEIVGKVNMDMSFLLFPIEAMSFLEERKYIEIWGKNLENFERISKEVGLIAYEPTCLLNSRVPRNYTGKNRKSYD
jgi:alanine racemase